jgi:hypothetical protein
MVGGEILDSSTKNCSNKFILNRLKEKVLCLYQRLSLVLHTTFTLLNQGWREELKQGKRFAEGHIHYRHPEKRQTVLQFRLIEEFLDRKRPFLSG